MLSILSFTIKRLKKNNNTFLEDNNIWLHNNVMINHKKHVSLYFIILNRNMFLYILLFLIKVQDMLKNNHSRVKTLSGRRALVNPSIEPWFTRYAAVYVTFEGEN